LSCSAALGAGEQLNEAEIPAARDSASLRPVKPPRDQTVLEGFNSQGSRGGTMASIRMVPEDEAVGKVKTIYQEIKQQFGIDFVPNLYRVMATNPGYLEANWNKVKAVMFAPGKLDRLTKEIIAVAVSAVLGCRY
jgi:hypothetical protein